jgi:hypothetical protein
VIKRLIKALLLEKPKDGRLEVVAVVYDALSGIMPLQGRGYI